MTKKMYRAITEWDMGMEFYVYKSRDDAWRDIQETHEAIPIEGSFDECVEDGFYSVETLEVVEFDNE